jgi:hypothetical protein
MMMNMIVKVMKTQMKSKSHAMECMHHITHHLSIKYITLHSLYQITLSYIPSPALFLLPASEMPVPVEQHRDEVMPAFDIFDGQARMWSLQPNDSPGSVESCLHHNEFCQMPPNEGESMKMLPEIPWS